MAKEFEVTLEKSLIGCSKSQKATLEALGLRRRTKSVVVQDNLPNRGQILKVQHLVKVVVLKK